MGNKTVILASDHAGFELKNAISRFLQEKGYKIDDIGAEKFEKDDDYPEFIAKAAKKIATDPEGKLKAIVFGGTGQGEAMVANRFPGVRAAVWYGERKPVSASANDGGPILDLIELSRKHNDANVLSIGAWFVKEDEAKEAIIKWLTTPFSGEERHARRIEEMDSIE